LLVDDVITTGGSTLTALDRINEQVPGVEIVAAVTLADRGDTASKAFADRGIRFVPLCTYRELGIDPVVPPQ
jgi:orotate phosphoribosyltransferase